MRTLPHPALAEIGIGTVLEALAEPVRRQIVSRLAEGHTDLACLAFELPVSKSTSTHHFRVLREAGVIEQHYQGTAILNRLRAEELEARFPGLLNAVITAHRSADLGPVSGLPAEVTSTDD
jgi:DNA-binding transcriptional ArsR family regulator